MILDFCRFVISTVSFIRDMNGRGGNRNRSRSGLGIYLRGKEMHGGQMR